MTIHRCFVTVLLASTMLCATAYAGEDVRVAHLNNTTVTELEYDPSTGVLWAAQILASGSFGHCHSINSGRTWVSCYLDQGELADIDVTAVGGKAYVGTVGIDGVVTIIEREPNDATPETLDVSAHGVAIEIAMASNADTFVNRAYVGVLTNTGRVVVYWKDTVSGGGWNQLGSTITNALSGLSLHYNDSQQPDSPYLVASYLRADDRIFVIGATSPADTWDFLHAVDGVESLFGVTRVAAYKDTFIVGYETTELIGGVFKRGIFYAISEDGGEDWIEFPLFVPANASQGYTRFDIAARGNQGLTAVAVQNTSPVTVQVATKNHYSALPATWSYMGTINDFPMLNAAPVTIGWLGGGFGITYEASNGATYLDNILEPLFTDGFESGDTSAWSQ